MTTEERLEKVEKELARAKRRNRWLPDIVILTLFGITLISIGIAYALILSPSRTIQASEFVLMDKDGRKDAELVTHHYTPGGRARTMEWVEMRLLYDDPPFKEYKSLGVSLKATHTGGHVQLHSDYGASLLGGTGLAIMDEDAKEVRSVFGRSKLILFGETGEGYATLGVDSAGPYINLIDEYGKTIWHAP